VPIRDQGNTMDANKGGSYRAFLREISATRVWLLFVTRAMLFAGMFCVMPHLQTELTNYFLRQHTDEDIKCTGHHHHEHHGPPPGEGGFHGGDPGGHHGGHHGPPHECIQAHTDVLIWTTGKTLFSALTVSLFLNPAVGTWSDMYGRKPFLLYALFSQLIPFVVVLLYIKTGLPLWWYFISLVVAIPFSSQSICLAYIADVITQESRILAFGLLSLMFSIGVIIGTGLTLSGVTGSLETSCFVGGGMMLVSTLMVWFFIPESLTPELQNRARAMVADKRANSSMNESLSFCWTSFKEAMKILWRTSFFRKLTIIMFIVSMVSEEYIEFKTQYLQEVLHFGTTEQTVMMMIMGVSGFVIMTLGMWVVKSLMNSSDKQILLIGTSALAASFLLLAIAEAAWMAYLSTALVSFWMFLMMAISSMKAGNVQPEEQGAVQGALTAISSVGFGLGPLLFLALYVAFRHGAVYLPGAPFYFGFGLMIVTVFIALSLRPPPTRPPSEISIDKQDDREPLIPSSS